MKISNLRYASADKRSIACVVDEGKGPRECVLTEDGTKSWYCDAFARAVAGKHGKIAAYTPPVIDPTLVKAERQRRINSVADADRQAYYSRLMIALLERGKDTWTPDEIAIVEAIRTGNAKIDAIVAAADALEALNPIPADFADDKHWP